jgi:Leucine-rich repeat (LRR) protein
MDSRIEPNELVKQLIKENLSTLAPYLDLAFCGLQGDEPALEMLAECKHLKALYLADPSHRNDSVWSPPHDRFERKEMGRIMTSDNFLGSETVIPDYLPTSLEYFCMGGTVDGSSCICDISTIARLTHLKYLDLSFNDIEDLSPLQGLTNLECLLLQGNLITDLSPLASLDKLWQLDIGYNDSLEDISPLDGLTKLRHLEASACCILSLKPLQSLIDLERLWLNYNVEHLGNLKELKDLVRLKELSIVGNALSELRYLADLHQLEVLDISNINFMEGEEECEDDYCDEEDNPPHYNEDGEYAYTFDLPALPALEKLKTQKCSLEELPLPHLPQLQVLDLSENQLKTFLPEWLEACPKLKRLNLTDNPIENLPQEAYNHTNSLHQVKALFNQNN